MNEFLTLVAEDYGIKGNLENWAGNVTFSGLLIVFGMLILLIIIFSAFGAVMQMGKGKKKPVVQKEVKKTEVKAAPVKTAPVASAASDDEVIAAISAAVAMMYEGTGKTPVIRSIKPAAKGVRSAWATAGIMNNTRAF